MDHRVNIITHVHTDASSAETSELNTRISATIHRYAGADTPITWAECFTPVEHLEQLLRTGHGDNGPVHMVVVTDHMRSQSHRLPDGHLAAAARTQQLALGAELATRTRDVDGCYRHGPEILAFGGRLPVQGPHGPYHGLAQELIDELYDTCRDEEGQELCTRRARDLLRQRGIAHALSHPLDGHALSLEGTMKIISEFEFIETLNGGYSARSARMLEAYVRLNNALLDGASLPTSELSPLGRRIVDHICREGRRIHTLSGSDAHSHTFDRVVTAMAAPAGRRPADLLPDAFFDRLLTLSQTSAHDGASFTSLGCAATVRSLLSDVSTIILRNARRNIPLCLNPIVWSQLGVATVYITQDELRWRWRTQRRRVRQLRREFDPMRLLPLLQPDARQQATADSPAREAVHAEQVSRSEGASLESGAARAARIRARCAGAGAGAGAR